MEIQNKRQANINLILVAFISLVILILFFKGCSGDSVPNIQVATKEIKGKFEAVKPIQTQITKRFPDIRKTLTQKEDNFLQGQIDVLIAENKALQQFYNESSDSLKTALYNKAIELKSFNHTFDNDTITATTSGLVRGEIQSINLEYKIKPIKIEVPKTKETVFRLLAGGGVGINKELNQISYNYTAGFQNKKGNVIVGNFQKIGSENVYSVKYLFSIWNIKK